MVSPHGLQVALTNLFLSLFDWGWGPKLAYVQLGIWTPLHLSLLWYIQRRWFRCFMGAYSTYS